MTTKLACKHCDANVEIYALARHAQYAHGVSPNELLALGKGLGLWELLKHYDAGPGAPETKGLG